MLSRAQTFLVLTAIQRVLTTNDDFKRRSDLETAQRVCEAALDIDSCLDADGEPEQLVPTALRPLPISDELKQMIVDSTIIRDRKPHA